MRARIKCRFYLLIVGSILSIHTNVPAGVIVKRGLSKVLSKMGFVLPNKYFLIKSYGGKIYLNLRESRMMIDRALGIYEYWKTKLFFHLVKQGMTIVDVGVNKGYYSLLFAKLMNDKGRVLSFEPVPENCFWIRQSIEANGYRCIKLHQCALSNEESTATFYLGKKSGFGSLFYSSYRTGEMITVKTRMLDKVLDEEGINDIDLMKIDVEGGDLLVLDGTRKLLQTSQKLKIVMDIDVQTIEEKNELFELLTSFNFIIYDIRRNLKPIRKVTQQTKQICATK